jgi:RNA polymerase sigma-70 factor (TIGR02943 family)
LRGFYQSSDTMVARALQRVILVTNATATIEPTKRTETRGTNPSEWLDLYGDFLFNFAVGQIRNTSEAEDLVQETFLAAIKSRDRFAGQCSERTWLVSILRHKICDQLRSKSRQPQPLDMGHGTETDVGDVDESLVWLHETAADCLRPDRRMDLQEFRAALELALGSLPARIAQVFQLYEIEEREGHEVCAALNISESNLWVMLHRAPTWGKERDSSRGG